MSNVQPPKNCRACGRTVATHAAGCSLVECPNRRPEVWTPAEGWKSETSRSRDGTFAAVTGENEMNEAMDSAVESGPMAEMPRYKCHREVWALKIKAIEQAPAGLEAMHAGGDWLLIPEDEGYGAVCVGHNEYFAKHGPKVGGYCVVYDDGYKSYSPAAVFESGYTRI